MTMRVTYRGKFPGDTAAVMIHDCAAWAVGEARDLDDAVADRIKADFPDYFTHRAVKTASPPTAPVDPAKE